MKTIKAALSEVILISNYSNPARYAHVPRAQDPATSRISLHIDHGRCCSMALSADLLEKACTYYVLYEQVASWKVNLSTGSVQLRAMFSGAQFGSPCEPKKATYVILITGF